uniref:cilium assembly protein DZIP1L n=1 Tax=Euleptes europaea TaxID=460621 RepID=UPI0025422CC0|nr:cilium assembly protein DZIP1L [Euleptes europaea]
MENPSLIHGMKPEQSPGSQCLETLRRRPDPPPPSLGGHDATREARQANTATRCEFSSPKKPAGVEERAREAAPRRAPTGAARRRARSPGRRLALEARSQRPKAPVAFLRETFFSLPVQSRRQRPRQIGSDEGKPFAYNIYYPLLPPVARCYWSGIPRPVFPMNYPSSGDLFGNMLASPGGIPAFKFQSRRDAIDWRRFSAIDVERVARELDLATLQENINSITFCNLDAEKCPYCQQPVDPVLLKVLKMAQLTIEYLLHSQEYLSMSLALQEERQQAALDDLKHVKHDLDKQAEELKCVKEESRKRKKMICTQQLLLQAGANSYHKCQLCDKSFVNYSYLQAHMKRRHSEATEDELKKKKQVEQMENEIEALKIKLKETHAQLEAESQRRAQEAENIRQREEEGRKKFESWKEEERRKFQKEMEDLRQLFLTEFKDISNKNSNLEEKLHELQVKNIEVSNLGILKEDDSNDKQQWSKTQRELEEVKTKIEQQKLQWKKRLNELQKAHQMEKEELTGENERLRASLSTDQWKMAEHNKQQIATFTEKLREQAKIIQSQEKTIKRLSSSKAREFQEASEAQKTEESTEEELEDTLDRKKRVLEALRRNPNLLKQFRPILEETLEEKLESMGVKRGMKGISSQSYKNLKGVIKTQQQQKAKNFPHLLTLRGKLEQTLKEKLHWSQKDENGMSVPFSGISVKTQRSPRSPLRVTSSKSKKLQAELQPYAFEVPKPAPRSKVSSMTNSLETPRLSSPKQVKSNPLSPQPPAVHHHSTSPFSSEEEEESEEESSFTSPKLRALKTKPDPPKVTQNEESDWDSSDIEPSQGKSSTGKVLFTAATPSETLVQSMAKNLERTLAAPGRKPVGGVKLFSIQTKEDLKPSNSIKKLQFVEEDSDLDISSFEEITPHLDTNIMPKKQHAVRGSGDSAGSQTTSVWGSSSTKADAW